MLPQDESICDADIKKKVKNVFIKLAALCVAVVIATQVLELYEITVSGQGTAIRVPSCPRSTEPVAVGCVFVDMTVTGLLSIHTLAVTLPRWSIFDSPLWRRDRKYLKVTIFCRYIFLRIEIKLRFARTKICDSHAELVRGR